MQAAIYLDCLVARVPLIISVRINVGSGLGGYKMEALAEAVGSGGRFFRPRRLTHANLFVSDYKKAFDFYHRVAGFNEVYRQPQNSASFLSNGNTYHDLALTDIRSKYAKPGQQPGLYHIAFELETEVDLVEGYRKAVAAGAQFAFARDHDVCHSVYCRDPDGNVVEIYADVLRDWRNLRRGIVTKPKPEWIPGVTNVPSREHHYETNPIIDIVDEAIFHPLKITHVALYASNFDDMIAYYRDLVGLELVVGGPRADFALLAGRFGRGDLLLMRSDTGKTGMHHMGFQVGSEQDLDLSLQKLREREIEPEKVVEHPIRKCVIIKDHDGLMLQFYADRHWSSEMLNSLDATEAASLL